MNHRYEFVFLFDVRDGNPNGDPDAGNQPRMDPETGHGLVTDVCIKRKLRNFVMLTRQDMPGYDIYVREKAILNNQHQKAYQALKIKPESRKMPKDLEKARAITGWMCQNFYDIRTFGAVMSTDVNCGQVRGPVQLTFARSVDPVLTMEHAITRMAVTTARESNDQSGGNRTMGRKSTIPYGLYRMEGFVNPFLARQTGFDERDLEVFFNGLERMFEWDRSASRGMMSARKLVVFRHRDALGNAPASALFDSVRIKKRQGVAVARSPDDYEVFLPSGDRWNGVEVFERF